MASDNTKLPSINTNGHPNTHLNPGHFNHRGSGTDFERWVCQQMDLLKMKSLTSHQTLTGIQLPPRLADKMFNVHVDERNGKGETLLASVILYVMDDIKQVKFMNLLLRLGANPNLRDIKRQRTPIMFACLHKKVAAVRVLVNHPEMDLSLRDHLGNTALMYAALQGDRIIIDLISTRLAKSWSFDVFLNKNRTGKTAESMALWAGKSYCADILRTSRMRMLQRMHKQLALVHYSAKLRGWRGYSETYYAVKLWKTKVLVSRRPNSVSTPDLINLEEEKELDDNSAEQDHKSRSGNNDKNTLPVIIDRRRAISR